MIRLGLCCIFRGEPIRFKRKTARSLRSMSRPRRLEVLSEVCLANARSLSLALSYCRAEGIGDFRITSRLLPLYTHPELGYDLEELPLGGDIIRELEGCREFRRSAGLRTTFHPDQFVLLSSPRPEVTASSLAELNCQAMLGELVGADVLNIHGGGAYNDKASALDRLRRSIGGLPESVRSRLTLENDDRIYSPEDLLPVCEEEGIPLVYDVHHHRCLGDGLSIAEATGRALATWSREPLFHLSSPRDGWNSPRPTYHSDYIDPRDFPDCWLSLDADFTVEVEAKAKELAVLRLKTDLKL